MSTLTNTWITINKDRMGGAPCIKGTRITVSNILDMLTSGATHQEIIEDFPSLDKIKINAATDFGAEQVRKNKMANVA